MFEHFIGRVFRFDDEPQRELPFVDFPLHTQDEATSESLLIQMDPEDLNEKARLRIEKRIDNSPLPIELLRTNHGIEPEQQIAVYKEITSNIEKFHERLAWDHYPRYKQLDSCCDIIWKNWIDRPKNHVYSAKQLTYRIMNLSNKEPLAKRISNELEGTYAAKTVNEAVERVLSFERNWAGFDFPQYLMALDRIQRFIFESAKMKAGDYSFYAKQVESLFLPEICAALDEYGVPVNVTTKCPFLVKQDSLSDAIKQIERVDIRRLKLHPYEIEVLAHAKEGF
jgi:hypothetical protein